MYQQHFEMHMLSIDNSVGKIDLLPHIKLFDRRGVDADTQA